MSDETKLIPDLSCPRCYCARWRHEQRRAMHVCAECGMVLSEVEAEDMIETERARRTGVR